jgi:hypothetical protein
MSRPADQVSAATSARSALTKSENTLFVPHCADHQRSMPSCPACATEREGWAQRHEQAARDAAARRARWLKEEFT